jgi:hypothetical protein
MNKKIDWLNIYLEENTILKSYIGLRSEFLIKVLTVQWKIVMATFRLMY